MIHGWKGTSNSELGENKESRYFPFFFLVSSAFGHAVDLIEKSVCPSPNSADWIKSLN